MKGIIGIKNIDDWYKLPRIQKIQTLFECPPNWRCTQAKDLWGSDAYGYGSMVNIPYGAPWNEIVDVVFASNYYCNICMRVKSEYISDIEWLDFKALIEQVNKLGKPCQIHPEYAKKEFNAFNCWRSEMKSGKRRCFFHAQKFDDNTLILTACTERGDNGDEDGFGVEPDMWTSALFDLQGNPVQPFRPEIIQNYDE